MKKITKEWFKAANDDLEVIKKIIELEHLTHIVAFHAQQCVEKCFKGVIEEHGLELLKTHDLERLLEIVEGCIHLDVDLDILQTLDKLYIDSRYPGDLGLLPEGKPTLADAQQFYEFARDIYNRVKQSL
jgi:HEPN domain-containing protein